MYMIYEASLTVYQTYLQLYWSWPRNETVDGFEHVLIKYKLHLNDTWNGKTLYVEADNRTATLKGLTPGEKYDVQISTTSLPTTEVPTTGDPSVSDPIIYDGSIFASNTNLQVRWSWPIERPVVGFQIEYRLSGTDTWNVIYAEANERMTWLEGVTVGEIYEVRISIIKGDD
ncbi:uncharacterized protein [Amphiura filiformis]|uniref:uncharacterized protein n=1 Tax=Amphiura filiformis TaxID=82378 RepID=UPI003B225B2E